MFYTGKPKATDSAKYRWGLQAAQAHGASFAHWDNAKNTSINCTFGHGKNGNLYNCVAKAKASRRAPMLILSAIGAIDPIR